MQVLPPGTGGCFVDSRRRGGSREHKAVENHWFGGTNAIDSATAFGNSGFSAASPSAFMDVPATRLPPKRATICTPPGIPLVLRGQTLSSTDANGIATTDAYSISNGVLSQASHNSHLSYLHPIATHTERDTTNAYSCCRLLWFQNRTGRKPLRSDQTGAATNLTRFAGMGIVCRNSRQSESKLGFPPRGGEGG